jgi:hypothetical protein
MRFFVWASSACKKARRIYHRTSLARGGHLKNYESLEFKMSFSVWALFWPTGPDNCPEKIKEFVRVFFNRLRSTVRGDLDGQYSSALATVGIEDNNRQMVILFSPAQPPVFIKFNLVEQKIVFASNCPDTNAKVFETVVNIVGSHLRELADAVICSMEVQKVLYKNDEGKESELAKKLPADKGNLLYWCN